MSEQEETIQFEEIFAQDIDRLSDLNEILGYTGKGDYFKICFGKQSTGELTLFIISHQGQDCGYGILNFVPKYNYYRHLGAPEIQDINVIHAMRNRGLATSFIAFCEELARKKGYTHMGISVGLNKSYGPAQRLYAKLGYIPDGHGITYDRHNLGFGEMRPNDDHLCLMLIKHLAPLQE